MAPRPAPPNLSPRHFFLYCLSADERARPPASGARQGRFARVEGPLHAGFNTTFSPVADPATSPLRQADLFGFSGGVDFQLAKFGASVGAGYQFGSSPERSTTGNFTILQTEISLQSVWVFYAISYEF